MAIQIGELFVRIGAETSSLQKGFLNAELSTKNLEAGFKKIKAAAPYAVAAVAAVGAALVVNLVKNTMASIDAQAKLARQLDTTIQGLATLQLAGAYAGIETQQMNKMLERLNINLGEASDKASPAAEALKRLGLSAKDLGEMNADEKISAIMTALKDSVPATDQAAVLNDLLGKVGQRLLNLDPETIAQAAREVEALGLAVSEKDAQTIERAGDAIYTLTQVFQGMANKITTRLGPVIEGVAVALKDWAIESRGFEDTFNDVVKAFLWATKWIANTVWGLVAVFEGLKVGVAIATTAMGSDFARFGITTLETIKKVMTALDKFNAWVNSWAPEGTAEFFGVPEKSDTSGIDSAISQLKNLTIEGDAAKEVADEAKKAFEDFLNSPTYGDRLMTAIDEASKKSDSLFKPNKPEGGGTGTGGEDEKAKQEREAREQRLQEIRDSFRSEMDQEILNHKELEQFLAEEREAGLIKEAEYNQLSEQEAQRHADAMKKIKQDEVDSEVGISKRGWADQLKNQSNAMKAMLGNLRGNLDTLFGENKAYALAMGLIDAYKAISASYKFGSEVGGPPLGAAMAAIAAAAQFKTLSDMQSVQIGSGGKAKGGGGGGGGGGPVASAPSPAQAAPTGPTGYATINIVGGDSATFTGAQVRALIEQINDEVAKGMVVRVA